MYSEAYSRSLKMAKEIGLKYEEWLEQGKQWADKNSVSIVADDAGMNQADPDKSICCSVGAVFLSMGKENTIDNRFPGYNAAFNYIGGHEIDWLRIMDANDEH